jgi:hypothetical protein
MAPKVKTAKNSKLPKLSKNCFEPVGRGGWPPISTCISKPPHIIPGPCGKYYQGNNGTNYRSLGDVKEHGLFWNESTRFSLIYAGIFEK